MRDVKGKIAFNPGAGMGRGRWGAMKFGAEGARLIITDVNGEALEQVRAELAEAGRDVAAYVLDVTNRQAVYALAERTAAEVGVVQILVNNAGIVYNGDLLMADDGQIAKTVEVNLMSHFWLYKAFLPGMIAAGEGHVLTMASAAGLMGVAGVAPYSASKWAAIGLCESVRYEMLRAHNNVKFTIVCPGFVSTGMFAGAKPPLFTKFLSPERLVEAAYRGFRRNKVYVVEPFGVKFTPFLHTLLPKRTFDRLQAYLGVNNSTQHLTGRR